MFRFYALIIRFILYREKIYFNLYITCLSYLEDNGGSADSAGVHLEYCPLLTSVHDDTNLC